MSVEAAKFAASQHVCHAINAKDHDTELRIHERFAKYGFSAKPMLDFLRSHSDPELLFAQSVTKMMRASTI